MTRRSRHKINRVTQPPEADVLRARLRGLRFRVLGFRIAVGSSYTPINSCGLGLSVFRGCLRLGFFAWGFRL